MDILDLIVIFLVILPVVGKLIDKSLKSAGKFDTRKNIGDVPGPLYHELEDDDIRQDVAEDDFRRDEESYAEVMPEVAELLEGGYKSVKDIIRERQSNVIETGRQADAGKLDIDPKKLVIYSEIMNPKF